MRSPLYQYLLLLVSKSRPIIKFYPSQKLLATASACPWLYKTDSVNGYGHMQLTLKQPSKQWQAFCDSFHHNIDRSGYIRMGQKNLNWRAKNWDGDMTLAYHTRHKPMALPNVQYGKSKKAPVAFCRSLDYPPSGGPKLKSAFAFFTALRKSCMTVLHRTKLAS